MNLQFAHNTPPVVTIPDHDTSPHTAYALDTGNGLPKAANMLLMQLDDWDPASAQHCRRVAAAASSLGKWLGLDKDTLGRLRLAAYLHDIGKLRARQTILQKPDRLTDQEYAEIKSHAATGADILRMNPIFDDIIDIVHFHHERWDGCGYPTGLDSTYIPLEARIIAIVDTWDAITAMRSYERRRPEFLSLSEIRRYAGSQFDPDIAAAFIEMVFDRIESQRRSA